MFIDGPTLYFPTILASTLCPTDLVLNVLLIEESTPRVKFIIDWSPAEEAMSLIMRDSKVLQLFIPLCPAAANFLLPLLTLLLTQSHA